MKTLVLVIALTLSQASSSYRNGIEKYRQDRIEELTAPNGWLAVRGLFWLHEGANTAGSDPSSEIKLPPRVAKRLGVFTLNAGQVTFTADGSAFVAAEGRPVTTYKFARPGERSAIVSDGVTLFMLRRGDRVGEGRTRREGDVLLPEVPGEIRSSSRLQPRQNISLACRRNDPRQRLREPLQ